MSGCNQENEFFSIFHERGVLSDDADFQTEILMEIHVKKILKNRYAPAVYNIFYTQKFMVFLLPDFVIDFE